MVDEDRGSLGVIGVIVIFSFISVVFLFMSMLIVGSINNYALAGLENVSNSMIASGVIPASFASTFDSTAETFINIIPYFDIIWFGSFISLVISSLIYSYLRKRENYFSVLSMSVLGIILVTYIGGIFIQLTDWFNINILLKVFPTFTSLAPIFSWYLNNMAVINLILIVVNIIANFIDLDFSKFNKRKEGESLEEI